MQSFKLCIPPVEVQNDLTIIYKEGIKELHEIKVPKDDLLKTLRYFQRQSSEIDKTKLIYIQENIKFSIFENFISSISTKEISLDESNYESYYELSCKYEYLELQKQIECFISTRPDIFPLIDELCKSSASSDKLDPNSSNQKNIDFLKEEIIAKHLDVSLKNGSLKKLPIETLIRILNSPKRQITDCHLLFSFIFDLLQETKKKNLNEIEKENYFFLPNFLDFSELTAEELEELFELEESLDISSSNGINRRMKKFIENEKKMNEKIDQIESQLKNLMLEKENDKNEIKKIQEKHENDTNEIYKRITKLENNEESIINNQNNFEKKIENIELNSISNLTQKVEKIENMHQNLVKQNQSIEEEIQKQSKQIEQNRFLIDQI